MTQVNWKRLLTLTVLFVGLGTAAIWLQYKYKPQQEEKKEQEKKLFRLKDTQIASVKIVTDGKTYAFRCLDVEAKLCKPGDNSKWEVLEPLKLKGDDSNINSLISSLNSASSTETIDLSGETPQKKAALLKDYRLDEAARAASDARRIEITTAKGDVLTAHFGDTHPIGESVFTTLGKGKPGEQVKPNENEVVLVPNYFKMHFERDLTYWRDKKLFTLAAHEVQSFKYWNDKASLTGSRKSGQWSLLVQTKSKKEELPGDIENIDNLMTAATYLSAKKILTENKADRASQAALRGARKVVEFTLEPAAETKDAEKDKNAKQPVTLTVFEKKGAGKGAASTVYATVSNLDPLYELEASAKDRLSKNVLDFRLTKLITSMERFTTKKVTFEGTPVGGKPLTLSNNDSKWVVSGENGEVDQDKVQNFLDRLSGNRIQDFLVSGAPAGEKEGLKITTEGDKPEAKRTLVLWKNGQKLYARDLNNKKQEVFVVDPAISEALPWKRDFFLKAQPAKPQENPQDKKAEKR